MDATGRSGTLPNDELLPDGSTPGAQSRYYNNGGSLVAGDAFRSFRSIIAELDYELVPLSSFGASQIDGLDALVLEQPTRTEDPWSADEIAAVQSFVSNGKGLFVQRRARGHPWRVI